MSQINKKTIESIANVRNNISTLQASETPRIIQFGAALEEVMGEVTGFSESVDEALIKCLTVLQAIYQEQPSDISSLVKSFRSVLVAIEQVLVSPDNPVCESMLLHSIEKLDADLTFGESGENNESVDIIEPIEETQAEESPIVETIEPPTFADQPENTSELHEIAIAIVGVSVTDREELLRICNSLRDIAGSETINADVKKSVIQAGRELNKIIAGKSENPDESLAKVSRCIEEAANREFETASPAEKPAITAVETPSKPIEIMPEFEEEKVAAPVAVVVEKPAAVREETKEEKLEAAAKYAADDLLPADTDKVLVGEFITESREYLQDAEAALLTLESTPNDSEAINRIFRAFHTIKGTSAFLGLTLLTDLTHNAENLFSRIRDKEIICAGAYANLSLRSVDMVKEMLISVENALDGTPMKRPEIYDLLLKVLKDPEANGVSSEPNPEIEQMLKGKIASDEIDSEELLISTRIGDILISMKKVTPEVIDKVMAQKGNEMIGEALIKNKVVSPDDVQEALVVQKRLRSRKKALPAADASVRVRTDLLDRLIDMVGELVVAQSMLSQDESLLSGGHFELARKVTHAGKIVRELQDLSMGMRMVPLKATFQKMARLVRDVAQKCGKQVEFTTDGEDTEIDRNMVDIIGDPLVHMARNAVDHGIETPENREKAGKNKTGKIKLSAYHAGGSVVVELVDDGKGLDRDRIIKKAMDNGLIESEKGMSENDINNLIFAPGFSTAEAVTSVSGRGVGMDVVRRNIEAIRGRVDISSQKGNGSVFTVKLPLTLAITDGMLVRIGNERFIVPTINIHLSFQPNASSITSVVGRGELVSLRGELMPIFRLNRLFDIENAVEKATDGLLMVVTDGSKRCAILVDELLGQHQVVVKPLALGEKKKVDGVSGGAILGDGKVGLILDTAEIVALARQNAAFTETQKKVA